MPQPSLVARTDRAPRRAPGRRRTLWAAIAVGVAAALALSPHPAAGASGPLVPCPAPAECGVIPVPLDHADPGGRQLGLAVARLRARTSAPRRGALLFLTGGPGQAGLARGDGAPMRMLRALSRNRDVVAVDVRGTGRSGALRCRSIEDAPEADGVALAAACAEELGTDRRRYTTRSVVADLEIVRRALGVDTWAVGGASYGSHVAVSYARLHPRRVEALLLDSPVGPGGVRAVDTAQFSAARRVLGEMCAGRRCAGGSDLRRDVARLVARIEGPGVVANRVDDRGRAVRVRLQGPAKAGLVFGALTVGDLIPAARAGFPAAVRTALRGDASALVRLASAGGAGAPPHTRLSPATFLATICSEAALPWTSATATSDRARALADLAAARTAAELSPFSVGVARRDPTARACLGWPEAGRSTVPAADIPDVPALIVVGAHDVRTPVENARALVGALPRSHVVVVPFRGHSALSNPPRCVSQAVLRFFAGRPPGDCDGLDPPLPVLARSPGSIGELPGPTRAARTLAAVTATLDDAGLALELGAPGSGSTALAGVGPHGGRVRLARRSIPGIGSIPGITGLILRFDDYSVVPGVKVSGAIDLTLTGSLLDGRLVVGGRAAARGTLSRSLGGRLSGRLGGRRVRGDSRRATGTLTRFVTEDADDLQP